MSCPPLEVALPPSRWDLGAGLGAISFSGTFWGHPGGLGARRPRSRPAERVKWAGTPRLIPLEPSRASTHVTASPVNPSGLLRVPFLREAFPQLIFSLVFLVDRSVTWGGAPPGSPVDPGPSRCLRVFFREGSCRQWAQATLPPPRPRPRLVKMSETQPRRFQGYRPGFQKSRERRLDGPARPRPPRAHRHLGRAHRHLGRGPPCRSLVDDLQDPKGAGRGERGEEHWEGGIPFEATGHSRQQDAAGSREVRAVALSLLRFVRSVVKRYDVDERDSTRADRFPSRKGQ